MKKRWIVGGTLAVLLGISATGIAVNAQWLGGRWDASHAAADLAAHLQKLDGVTKATVTYNPLGLPNPTVVAHVVFAPDAPSAQWGAATALVHSSAGSRALIGSTSTAEFSQTDSKSSVTVEPAFFTPQAVAAEIAAWRQLRQVVGDRVSLRLGHASGWTGPRGPIVREYDVRNEADAREIAALWPDAPPAVDTAIPTSWQGPGLQWAGMPSKALMVSLSGIPADLHLASANPHQKQTGLYAVILAGLGGYKVTVVSLRDGKMGSGQPDERVARAAQAAFATGAKSFEWESSHQFGSLIAGSCPAALSGRSLTFFRLDQLDDFATKLADLGFRETGGRARRRVQMSAERSSGPPTASKVR